MSPEDEARSFGVHLAAYSHWPLGWHSLVLDVLRQASAFSVERLYIKDKFGSLRIQG